jgi:hypothetical protein
MGKGQLTIFFLMLAPILHTQTIYSTREGHILIKANIDGNAFKAESHQLSMFFDYTSKEITGSIDLRTIDTNNPQLATYLKSTQAPIWIRFSGKVPVEDFLLRPHEPIDFNWLVTIRLPNKEVQNYFKATLTHIPQGPTFSCLLSAGGFIEKTISPSLNQVVPGLDGSIEIKFAQLILKKE